MNRLFALLITLFFSHCALANDAMTAFSSKNYDEAYRIWSRDPGKPEALYGVGRIVAEGLGSAPKNVEKGLGLIAQSSDQGFRPSSLYLADRYEKDGSYSNAIKYLKRLSDGKNIEIEKKIFALYQKINKTDPSSSQQFCESATKVAELEKQSNGAAVESSQDITKLRELALCAIKGRASTYPKEEAVRFIEVEATKLFDEKSFDQASQLWLNIPDSEKSLFGLGQIAFEGLGGIKKDESKGRDLIQKSAAKDYPPARLYLAELMDASGRINAVLQVCNSKETIEGNDLKKKCANTIEKGLMTGASLSKEYCEVTAKVITSKSWESLFEWANPILNICSYTNLSTAKNKTQSITELKASLSKSTNYSFNTVERILLTIAPEILNESSPHFDPVLFATIIKKIDSGFESIKFKQIINTNITEAKCVDAPHNNELLRDRKLAICSLAAFYGSQKIAVQLARIFSSKTEYGPINPLQARKMLSLITDEREKDLKIAVELNLTLFEGNQHKNLDALSDYLKLNTKRDITLLQQHFEFQNSRLLEYDKLPVYTVSDTTKLTELVINLDSLEIMKIVLPGLIKFDAQEPDLLDNLGVDDSARERLKKNTAIIKSKIPESQLKELIRQSSLDQIKNSKQPLPKGIDETKNSKESSSPPQSYASYQALCAQDNHKACARAAQMLTSNNPPQEYKDLMPSDREKIAKSILKKCTEVKSEICQIAYYDLIKKSNNEVDKEYKKILLDDLVKRQNPAGLLRKYAELADPQDIISGTLGTALKFADTKKSCLEIKRLLTDGKLSSEDTAYATAVTNGQTCSIGLK